MCLIMLNLLIGILSEAMAGILGEIEMTDNAALCGIIFDLESLMFWVSQNENDEEKNSKHLVWGEVNEFQDKEDIEAVKEDVKGINDKIDNLTTLVEGLVAQNA